MRAQGFDFSAEPGKERKKREKESINHKPLVSIVTPYYNAELFFEQTFNSVMNQTLQAFEWIVVDDGSNQNSKDYLHQLVKNEPRIRLLSQENKGQAKARNKGIKNARTNFIVTLDADDLLETNYLKLNYRALQKFPHAAWSYTDSVGFYDKRYIWCIPFSPGRLLVANFLVSTAMFRKSALEKVGFYSELEKYYDEDWELYLKLLANNLVPIHIRTIGFWYRQHSAGMRIRVKNDHKLREKSLGHMQKFYGRIPLSLKAIEVNMKNRYDYKLTDKIWQIITGNRMGLIFFKRLKKIKEFVAKN